MKVGIVIRFFLEIYTLSTYSDVVSLLYVNINMTYIYIYVVRAESFQEIEYFTWN